VPEHVTKTQLLAEKLVNTNLFVKPYIYHQNGVLATENNVACFRIQVMRRLFLGVIELFPKKPG
jgi:hypothetical protein